ncbi:hypothetical protein MBLNU457_6786t1 [Dothideomycetes sp. NU457]
MSLADLPVELFDWILDFLSFSDYKSFHIVSPSRFRDALIPRLFSDYHINFDVDSLAKLSQASRVEPIAASIRTLHLDTVMSDTYLTRARFESRLDLRPRYRKWSEEHTPHNFQYMHLTEQKRIRVEQDQAYHLLDRTGGRSADELTASYDAYQAYRDSQLAWSESHDRELQLAVARLPKLRSVRASNFVVFEDRGTHPPPVWRRLANEIRVNSNSLRRLLEPEDYDYNYTLHVDKAFKTKAVACLIRALDYRSKRSSNEALAELDLKIIHGWGSLEIESVGTLPIAPVGTSVDTLSDISVVNLRSFADSRRLVVHCRRLASETIDTTNLTMVGQMLTASKALVDLSLEISLDDSPYAEFVTCDFLSWIGNPGLSNLHTLDLQLHTKGPTLLNFLSRIPIKSLSLRDCVLIDEHDPNTGTWTQLINRLHQVASLESYYFEGLWDCESNEIQYTTNWFDYGISESIEKHAGNYSREYCKAVRDAIMNGVPLQSLLETPEEWWDEEEDDEGEDMDEGAEDNQDQVE